VSLDYPFEPTVSELQVMRPLVESDIQAIYQLEYGIGIATKPLRPGQLLSMGKYASALWIDTLANLVILEHPSGASIGLLSVFGADFRNGVAYWRFRSERGWVM
jgi:hypothetical protein